MGHEDKPDKALQRQFKVDDNNNWPCCKSEMHF